jgi:hypothetical protein
MPSRDLGILATEIRRDESGHDRRDLDRIVVQFGAQRVRDDVHRVLGRAVDTRSRG